MQSAPRLAWAFSLYPLSAAHLGNQLRTPTAVDGIMDAKPASLARTIVLDGEWEFILETTDCVRCQAGS